LIRTRPEVFTQDGLQIVREYAALGELFAIAILGQVGLAAKDFAPPA
jgi:hypothetical protein